MALDNLKLSPLIWNLGSFYHKDTEKATSCIKTLWK